jgi:hypothetical protein
MQGRSWAKIAQGFTVADGSERLRLVCIMHIVCQPAPFNPCQSTCWSDSCSLQGDSPAGLDGVDVQADDGHHLSRDPLDSLPAFWIPREWPALHNDRDAGWGKFCDGRLGAAGQLGAKSFNFKSAFWARWALLLWGYCSGHDSVMTIPLFCGPLLSSDYRVWVQRKQVAMLSRGVGRKGLGGPSGALSANTPFTVVPRQVRPLPFWGVFWQFAPALRGLVYSFAPNFAPLNKPLPLAPFSGLLETFAPSC